MMIIPGQPGLKALVEDLQIQKISIRQKRIETAADGFEKALDFAFAFRIIRPGVDQCNAQSGTGSIQLVRTENLAIIGIKHGGLTTGK